MSDRKINKNNKGYTIIETMIAISLFIVIVEIGIGAILNANLISQKSRDIRSVVDNLNFVMEDMSRNMRTGYNYHCFLPLETAPATSSDVYSTPRSCVSGWAISFEPATGVASYDGIDDAKDDDQWVYAIVNIAGKGKIFKATKGPYNGSTSVQLTPDEINIDTTASTFSVLGAEPYPGNQQQPFVTVKLVGTITLKGVVTPFSLQTSVSQRFVDI